MRRLSGQLLVQDVRGSDGWTPLHHAALLVDNDKFYVIYIRTCKTAVCIYHNSFILQNFALFTISYVM